MNHVVIMAGGIGSRFWPLSTPEFPKQFIDILGCGRTLIQLTVDRFQGICPEANFWVVTNEKYVDIVRKQIPAIPAHHILAEPAARNTAPCIAWACWSIQQEDSEANIVVTPSDAVVMNPTEFQRVIRNALTFTAERNAIVTIGIKPNRPETGYGYVEVAGAPKSCASASESSLSQLAEAKTGNICRANVETGYGYVQTAEVEEGEICPVAAFKEKPNLETAQAYLYAGNYLWNAGIFVLNLHTITSALRRYKPNIATDMDTIIETGDVQTIFPQCEKISIDYAVMEPAAADGIVYTHPADFGWSDLGNWQSLYEKLQKDEHNNAAVGNVRFFEASNNVVHMESAKRVVIQGIHDCILSEKNGQFLICKRSEEQRIKAFSAED